MKCPLCHGNFAGEFFKKADPEPKTYFKCPDCLLIFLPVSAHLPPEKEKERYDQHQNDPDNAGYVKSLMKLVEPLAARLKPGARGLDFGCGPNPVLKSLFEARGFAMEAYDPFYFPDEHIKRRRFDFVACAEVIEHFRAPHEDFLQLLELLGPRGGRLAVMTQLVENERDFQNWWYHRDPTHICFYREDTLKWIAGWKRLGVDFPSKHVAIYTK